MLNGQTYYHGTLRKTIVAFGRLFSDIKIVRQDNDGNPVQTIAVPLAYAPKEKWLVRVDSDPNLNQHTYASLPRLSFEITGYAYDPARKTNKMRSITLSDATSTDLPLRKSVLAPAPYEVSIALYVLTKTQEDAMQIIEQILPTFTPDYTLTIQAMPEMNIIQDMPIILNGVAVEDNYDGSFQERRFVVHTLTFTIKTYLYGPVTEQGVITKSIANLNNLDSERTYRKYTATGVTPAEPIEENWESQF